jgi:nitroreductase
MNFFELIIKRHSVRAYQDKEVEEEKILKIMGAGLHSASAHNGQPYKVYVIQNPELRNKIVQAQSPINFWMKEAPVIFVICVNRKLLSGQSEFNDNYLDAGIMIENMMLAVTEQELGSCACAAFSKEKVRKVLEIPEKLQPILCLPIGYPREKQGIIDFTKSYEKLVHALTHYKTRKIEDIFERK